MTTYLSNLLCSVGILFLFSLSSCKKDPIDDLLPPDPCLNVTCNDNGSCNDGLCECELGYLGEFCENEIRTELLGEHNVVETCTFSSGSIITYDSNFATATNANQISINNLLNLSVLESVDVDEAIAIATLSQADSVISINMENQTFQSANLSHLRISGSGTYTIGQNNFVIEYILEDTDLNITDMCSSTYFM